MCNNIVKKRTIVVSASPNNKCTEYKHRYPMHDLMSVYTHYDPKLGINVPTPNKPNNK